MIKVILTINNEKQNLRTHQDLAYDLNTTSITLTPCTQVLSLTFSLPILKHVFEATWLSTITLVLLKMDEFSWRWDQTETILKTQVSGLWAKMKIYCSELNLAGIVLHPPLPFKNWRKQAKATPSLRLKSPFAALKSHLAIYLGDIPLTANQSTWCLWSCEVRYVLSARLPGLIVLVSFLLCLPTECGAVSVVCLLAALLSFLASFSFPRKPSHGCRAAPLKGD